MIRGVKEVFLPPQPKDLSDELKSYLREVERNLREIASRTYTDTESSFTGVGGIQREVEDIQEDLWISLQRIGYLESNVTDLESDISSLSTQISDLSSNLSGLQSTVNNLSNRLTAIENQVGKGGEVRPVSPYLYQLFFDSTLGQPIWWNGSAWVNSQGETV